MKACLTTLALVCLAPFSQAVEPRSIAEVLTKDGRFTTLLTAVGEAGLVNTLTDADAITLLAPTDDAFGLLPEGTLASLLLPENRQQLTDILTYHVIGDSLDAETASGLSSGQTLTGQALAIVTDADRLLVNDALVIEPDIPIANGIVHAIDRVLLPPSDPQIENFVAYLGNDGRFGTLIAAAEASGLFDPNNPATFPLLPESQDSITPSLPYTLLAPTDDAFAKLPEGTVESLLLPENKARLQQILLHHFLPFNGRSSAISRIDKATTLAGQELNSIKAETGLRVNNAVILEADQSTTAGTVHVIDTVLIPATDPETRGLAEILQADGRFTSLISALVDTDLLDTVVNAENITILAPTDSAFEALAGEDPQAITKLLQSGQLADVLRYHVVTASAPAETVRSLTSADTLLGNSINIVSANGHIFVNQAKVIDPDLTNAGGVVVHAIDSVITPPEPRPEQNIPSIATADGRFTTLLAAVEVAGLVETLSGSGPFTVLAPTDEAFASLPVNFLLMPENRELLTSILTYHVIPQDIDSRVLGRTTAIPTLQGESIAIDSVDESIRIDTSEIVIADVITSNGTIHAINEVLVPPSIRDTLKVLGIAEGDGRFMTLITAVEAAGLTDTLKANGPLTLLAPTDEAFARLPEGTVENLLKPENIDDLRNILLHHVIDGEVNSHAVLGLKRAEPLSCKELSIYIDDRDHTIYIDGSKVTQADISASNGLIHVIDTVLLPTAGPTEGIVDIALADDRFSTLVTALSLADLVETINTSEALTVFAPTNEAFDSLPGGLLDTLLAPENREQLRTFLLHHVLGSEGRAALLARLPKASTLAGQQLNLQSSSEGLSINNASVAIPDILATNGVVHVVDTVLLPSLDPEPRDLVQVLSDDGRFNTLLAAVEAAGLVETITASPALTLLAPTDDAFASLPEGQLASLLLPENQELLADLLLYHVVSGDVRAETVLTLKQAETAAGPDLNIVLEGEQLYLNQALVIQTDLPASNGVIHILDTVISPPTQRLTDTLPSVAADAGSFGTLLTAVEAAGLLDLLNGEGPFTILAPTDDAFAKLDQDLLGSLLEPENVDQLRDILLYHVFNAEIGSDALGRLTHPFTASGAGIAIDGSSAGLLLNGVNVATADLYGANGVIHVINDVLIPDAPFFEMIGADVKKGRLQLEWLTNRAGPYTLQASPNLQTWEDVLTTNAKQAEVEIEESERFYRVIR